MAQSQTPNSVQKNNSNHPNSRAGENKQRLAFSVSRCHRAVNVHEPSAITFPHRYPQWINQSSFRAFCISSQCFRTWHDGWINQRPKILDAM